MKLPFKERVFLSTVVIVLAGVLVALAVLQYNWSNQVSDATTVQLQASLESYMFSWRDDFSRELTGVFSALQADPHSSLEEVGAQYAQQYQTWSQTAPHVNLVSRILMVEGAGTQHVRLLQLNTTTSRFEPAEWPAELAELHSWIDGHSADLIRGAQFIHSLHSRPGFHPEPMEGGRLFNRRFNLDVAIDIKDMVLVRPQFQRPGNSPAINWTIALLDRQVLQEKVLPELTERYFSGSASRDYEVAVVGEPSQSLIYTSDSGFGKLDKASLDGTLSVFGPPRGFGPHPGGNAGPPLPPPSPHAQENGRHQRRVGGYAGPYRIAVVFPREESDWQLRVRHRKGSLEAVVARLRRRNLALSFGVLLVLAGGIAIILVSSRRARVLARLQMEFVAAVSHELRTPLAVISSAAENIADGVVAGNRLHQYGAEIKNQAKQLIQLVEQILLFAATRNKRPHYTLRPLRVTDVVETALKDTAGVIEAAGVTVEREIAPNLPPVRGDLRALSHCLQNLITNAVKYGGEARWMRIRARICDEDGRFEEVRISVEDKGLGIGSGELRRIFEPFYRSRAATAAQIHGTGLGLSLAKDIAEAMGGRLGVVSETGKGSCFSIYLPFADVHELQSRPQPAAAVNPNLSNT
jgi:signal transduction histidine kinase